MEIPFDATVSFSVILSVVALGTTFFRTRRKAGDDRFALIDVRLQDGSKRMDRHDGRIASVEQAVKNLPDKDDVHRLQLGLTEMIGEMKAMGATMDGNAKIMGRLEIIVTRHDDHLLEGKRG